MLQWHIPGESPFKSSKINSISDLVGGGMTVPVQRGSMAVLQPPRSRFMITDILAGTDGGVVMNDDGRSPSPQPRDLSVPPGGRHDDSDSDSSCPLDDNSVCSNGKFHLSYLIHL